jgi:hypothetical protein
MTPLSEREGERACRERVKEHPQDESGVLVYSRATAGSGSDSDARATLFSTLRKATARRDLEGMNAAMLVSHYQWVFGPGQAPPARARGPRASESPLKGSNCQCAGGTIEAAVPRSDRLRLAVTARFVRTHGARPPGLASSLKGRAACSSRCRAINPERIKLPLPCCGRTDSDSVEVT